MKHAAPLPTDRSRDASRATCDGLAPGVSIVVPVYNSADQLGPLAAAVQEALVPAVQVSSEGASSRASSPGIDQEVEVVFVNDGSTDASWQRIVELSGRYDWVRGIDLARNVGQHAALIAGACAASGGAIVTMDDDLQHPPGKIGVLVAELRRCATSGVTRDAPRNASRAGLVYGTPLSRGPLGFRRAGSFLARLGLACRLRSTVALRSSAFRAFDARYTAALSEFDQRSINIDAALAALGVRATSVQTAHGPSLRSESRYGVRSLVGAAGAVFRGPRVNHSDPSATGDGIHHLQVHARVGFGDSVTS